MQQTNRSKAEDWADGVTRRGKQALPHLARLLLVSPFLENGFRTWRESERQRNHLNLTLKCGDEVASLLVLATVLGFSFGPLLILARCKVKLANWLLGCTLLFQTLAQWSIWDGMYLLRVASLAGSLMLLSVDTFSKDRNLYAGIPPLSLKKIPSLTQLSGPCVVLLMVLALPETASSILKSVQNIICTLLWVCLPGPRRVRLGFFAVTLVIAAVLVLSNVVSTNPPREAAVNFSEYKLFPTLCVTGGFLMIVSLGFGDNSIFERRKKLAKTFTGSQTDLRTSLCDANDFKGFRTNPQNCRRRRSF